MGGWLVSRTNLLVIMLGEAIMYMKELLSAEGKHSLLFSRLKVVK